MVLKVKQKHLCFQTRRLRRWVFGTARRISYLAVLRFRTCFFFVPLRKACRCHSAPDRDLRPTCLHRPGASPGASRGALRTTSRMLPPDFPSVTAGAGAGTASMCVYEYFTKLSFHLLVWQCVAFVPIIQIHMYKKELQNLMLSDMKDRGKIWFAWSDNAQHEPYVNHSLISLLRGGHSRNNSRYTLKNCIHVLPFFQ